MVEEQTNNFAYFIEKAREAREKMMLGLDTVREDFRERSIRDRIRAEARGFGLGDSQDYGSIYSPTEQAGLARSDKLGHYITRGSNIGFGLMGFASAFLPDNKLGAWGMNLSMVPQLGRLGGLMSAVGTFTNPYSLGAMAVTHAAEVGMRESMIDPLTYARRFSTDALTTTRQMFGGIGSETGVGGMSLKQSWDVGRTAERYRSNFRGIEPENFSKFIETGATFANFQGDPKQAGETMGKFLSVITALVSQFKGRENELNDAMRQLAGMRFNIDQASDAVKFSSKMGTMMNIDPSRITAAGVNMTAAVQGSNINPYVAYSMGAKAFTQTMQMQQQGQYSQAQLANFGGAEGIAQNVAGTQMGLLNTKFADLFLKSIYNRPGTNGPLANASATEHILKGDMSVREAQFRSQATTLSPQSNMSFMFQRDSLISSLGENAGLFANQVFSAAMTQNPYGTSPEAKAKLLMAMNPGMAPQQAMLYVQSQMAYNPTYTNALEELSMNKRMAGTDAFYASNNALYRGAMASGQRMGYVADKFQRDINVFNDSTTTGRDTIRGLGDLVTFGLGEDVVNAFGDVQKNRVLKDGSNPFRDMTFADIKAARRTGRGGSRTDTSLMRVGNDLLYGNQSVLADDDRDFFRRAVDPAITRLNSIYKNGAVIQTNDIAEATRIADTATKELLENNPGFETNLMTQMGSQHSSVKSIRADILKRVMSKDLYDSAKGSILGGENTSMQLRDTSFFGAAAADSLTPGLKTNMMTSSGLANVFTRDLSRHNDFATKWNIAGDSERAKMTAVLQKISKNTASSQTILGYTGLTSTPADLSLEQQSILGVSRLDSDQAKMILGTSGVSNWQSLTPEQKKATRMRDSIDTLFNTSAYRDLFGAFGNEELGAGLVKELFTGPGSANKQELKITEENFEKLRKTHLPGGMSEIFKFAKYEDGAVSIDERIFKTRSGRNAIEAFQVGTGAQFENAKRANLKASEFWTENKMNQASTIQDFAVAVATGIRMADYSKLDHDSQQKTLTSAGTNKESEAYWNNANKQ